MTGFLILTKKKDLEFLKHQTQPKKTQKMKLSCFSTVLFVALFATGESRLRARMPRETEHRDLQVDVGCIYVTSADGTRRVVNPPCNAQPAQGAMEANVEEDTKPSKDKDDKKTGNSKEYTPQFPNLVPDRVVVGGENAGPYLASGTMGTGASMGPPIVTGPVPPSSGAGTAMESNVAPTVLSIIQTNPNLSRFYRLLLMSGLDTTLANDGPFTVFAPTNGAFPLGLKFLSLDSQNPIQDLQTILQYHMVSGTVKAEDLTNGLQVTTLQEGTATVSIMNGLYMINDANIVTTDIVGTNGVVHYIDAMLTPPEN